jgi:hypothetical protein
MPLFRQLLPLTALLLICACASHPGVEQESALSQRPYTVFYGHEHAYLHQQRYGRDYIRLATTGGVQNLKKDMAVDHVTLVTVSEEGIDIANLRMSGIFDKTGKIPLNGEELCFEVRKCANEVEK